jgi:AbrB family looped-hinge helix DNA binding protein
MKGFFSNSKQPKIRSTLPKAPPVPEEPLDTMPKGELVCDICGKTFKSHTQLDRHKMTEHEIAEERE